MLQKEKLLLYYVFLYHHILFVCLFVSYQLLQVINVSFNVMTRKTCIFFPLYILLEQFVKYICICIYIMKRNF